jgi:hypothetical protein
MMAIMAWPISAAVGASASCGYKLANDGHDTRRSKRISGIATFRIRCVTLSNRRRGPRISGGGDRQRQVDQLEKEKLTGEVIATAVLKHCIERE